MRWVLPRQTGLFAGGMSIPLHKPRRWSGGAVVDLTSFLYLPHLCLLFSHTTKKEYRAWMESR
jgi:hypothetical protein